MLMVESSTKDLDLFYTLACVECANCNHLSALICDNGSKPQQEMLSHPHSLGYDLIWHRKEPKYQELFKLLEKYVEKKLIRPLYTWPANEILMPGEPARRAQASQKSLFVLGREGRKIISQKFSIELKNTPYYFIYENFPLARFLTATSCALTVKQLGFRLIPSRAAISSEFVSPQDKPRRPPDFCAMRNDVLYLFYFFEAQAYHNPDSLISNIRKTLSIVGDQAGTILIARSQELLKVLLQQISAQGNASRDGDLSRIYCCSLKSFYSSFGRCDLKNYKNETLKFSASTHSGV